ncbi:MAG: hypothetical protein IJK15_09010 [Bacteroidaceae bacterium]|nr:hypothetical protein [Bacteroidaceae bacterium]
MFSISISEEIRERCPEFVGAAVFASVVNSEFDAALWQEIDRFLADYRSRYTPDSIKLMPSIEATRTAYRRCGKDPSRYRPSGEALVRRTLKGHDLYRVSTLVDLINLASIAYGYSIGGFDADKIAAPEEVHAEAPVSVHAAVDVPLTLGIGREGEPYEGIGRGPLNIAGLPVYRDAIGGIGTPTSDHERTKLSLETRHLLAIVNGYDGNCDNVLACAQFIQDLLRRYAQSDGGTIIRF